MDEQRFQAYVGLIEQLLSCPQGQEAELLQANTELVDAGLLAVMEQVADWTENQGNGNAGRLRQFAEQLAQIMGVETTVLQGTDAVRNFLLDTLQLVWEKRDNPQQIYSLWAQQQEQFNPELLAVLPTVAAHLFAGDAEQRTSISLLFFLFGNLINQFPLGMRWLNLELGITAYEQALQVYTRDAFPEEWARTQNNLANAYRIRIQGEHSENLERAITAHEQALQVYTRDAFPEEWAATQNDLANAYADRIRGNQAENLELAIATYEQALQVYTRDAFPTKWAGTQNNLANAYRNRIRGDRAENLELAIATYEQALQVYTRDAFPTKWAGTQNNLANAHADRIGGDRAENLERAIVAYEQALQVYTRDAFPEQWAMTQNNLANVYAERVQGERAENLERAIVAYEHALQVYTRDAFPEEWARTQNNLANAYRIHIRGERAENLERAISAYERALQVYTQNNFPQDWAMAQTNLAAAYAERIRGDRAENLERAISAYQNSLTIFTPELLPNDCRRSARGLANLYSDHQRWQEAEPIYQMALAAAEILYQSANLLGSRLGELEETAGLPLRAAYALSRVGNCQKAVETLEQGRARGLSESLNRDRSELTELAQTAPQLYQQYRDLTAQLRNLESQQRDLSNSDQRHSLSYTELRDTATALHDQLTRTITEIRQVEGYADFLNLPSYEDIRAALHPGCPLVYLVTTLNGSMALIVTANGSDVLWLDALTEAQLVDLLNQTWFSAYNQSQTDRQGWYDAINTVTRQLWDSLMGALLQKLRALGIDRITLVPTGYLSFLPLHAAWTEDPSNRTGSRYALDDMCITYTPNAQSLTTARAISDRVQADSILAIDNPLKDLPNSSREVAAAVTSFPQRQVLSQAEATIASVLAALPHCNILHFSCHGTANPEDPLNSGLLMSNGLLTLRDLLDLRLTEQKQGGIRLAVLSACETGLVGTELVDEAIGLPTGLLQAGVAGVVASLWLVSDLSTMMLLVRFYDLWRKDHLEPAIALYQAQLWIRDTTSQQKATYFKETNPDIFQSLILLDPDYFAHPFHWAAFSYVGI